MVISIPKCAFENSKVDFAKTYLAGQSSTTQLAGDETNSCVGVENGVNIDFSIVADMGACGMETVNNGTHTFYKNAVQCTHGNSNAIISRSRNVMVCSDFIDVKLSSLSSAQVRVRLPDQFPAHLRWIQHFTHQHRC